MISAKKIFTIDAIGAGVSSIMLGLVLTHFSSIIGLEKNILYFLSIIPISFLFFDIYSIVTINNNVEVKLKVIAFLNFIYTIISIYILYKHIEKLKAIGLVYFISEILIIYILIYFELKFSSQINK